MRDVLLFANPISGSGLGRSAAERIARRLTRAGSRVRSFLEPAGKIDPAVFHHAAEADLAIVIGGDGTLRSIAERLLAPSGDLAAPAGRFPPLLTVPLGNANLMGRHLHMRWSIPDLDEQVLQTLRRHHVRLLDTAHANGRLFILVAGVGMDAHIVHELDRVRTGPVGYTSYLLPSAMALGSYTYPPMTVTVDGRSVLSDTPAMAFVGNVPEYGTGFPLLPHARSDDGLLDVCVIPCNRSDQVLSLFLHAATGEHLLCEGVVYTKGRHVTIDSPRPIPLQLDGDPAGHSPVRIDLLPVRLPFIVPMA